MNEQIFCNCTYYPYCNRLGVCNTSQEFGCFKTYVKDCHNNNTGCFDFGCFFDDGPKYFLCHDHHQDYKCCSKKNFCNQDLKFNISNVNNDNKSKNKLNSTFSKQFDRTNSDNDKTLKIGLISGISAAVVLISIAIFVIYFIYKRSCNKKQTDYSRLRKHSTAQSTVSGGTTSTYIGNSTYTSVTNLKKNGKKLKKDEISSGRNGPNLVPRTITRDLFIMGNPIGFGRYGIIYKANWKMEIVAVKKFNPVSQDSFNRETDIYQTGMLAHDNILHYIACEINADERFLITEYHENGSLYDYLNKNTIDFNLFKKFSYSIVNGLSYLHMEIISSNTRQKRPIAHRDLKSKNILVKRTLECCISDFGLAVCYDDSKDSNESRDAKPSYTKPSKLEGTIRILAPEILDKRLNYLNIDDLKQTDIYAYSLVIWELIKRYRPDDNDPNKTIEDYSAPYSEYLSKEPTLEDMKLIVCDNKWRPTIINWKREDKNLIDVIRVMEECWQHEPFSRLGSLTIKKKFYNLHFASVT